MFSWIARAYNWVTGKVDSTVAGWVHDLISGLYGFLHSIFGTVIDAWNKFVRAVQDVRSAATSFAREMVLAWDYLWRIYIPSLRKWIDTHILAPLSIAWHWVTHEGAVLWHYITHIPQLVDLLWDSLVAKIEHEAWNIGRKLGTFFSSLIVHNLDAFIKLLEDVIDAIF